MPPKVRYHFQIKKNHQIFNLVNSKPKKGNLALKKKRTMLQTISSLIFYIPFLFCLTDTTYPKTQRLIDRYDIYNAEGDDHNHYKNDKNDLYEDEKGTLDWAVMRQSQSAHVCKWSVINGRMKTLCKERGLEKGQIYF